MAETPMEGLAEISAALEKLETALRFQRNNIEPTGDEGVEYMLALQTLRHAYGLGGPRYFCNKCGYRGSAQDHQRPNGSGECGYIARPVSPPADDMRAEFMAWVRDRGCDTDGAWSAWQSCWNRWASEVEAARASPADTRSERERFEALYGKRGETQLPMSSWDAFFDVWLARASLPAPTDAEWMKEAERLEVVSAWNDLPDALKAHPGLKRLYRALGGVAARPAEPTHSVDVLRQEELLKQCREALVAMFPYAQQGRPAITLSRASTVESYISAISKYDAAIAAIDAARQALEKP